MTKKRVLVIEDEEAIRTNVLEMLDAEGFEGMGAADGRSGIELFRAEEPDLVLSDIMLPEMDGYAVLEAVREHPVSGSVPFVFLSARAERHDIRRGMANGADDYVTKPFSLSELVEVIRTRLRRHDEKSTRPASTPPRKPTRSSPEVVVGDPVTRALHDQLGRVAQSNLSVLLLGETGSGKEVLARAIHRESGRASGPFVALNCAALTESLLESELFGHEKGAFTGAMGARAGLFEAAQGGTLFLDEIGDMPLSLQVKLLRVLEDRHVVRVGGRTPIAVDARFVAATHRDLEDEAERGTFRQDLYFRLAGITLDVPPLRARASEIPQLAALFAKRAAAELSRPVPSLAPETLAVLMRHRWPGNVRELRNVIERAVVLAPGSQLMPEHLPSKLTAMAGRASSPSITLTTTDAGREQMKRDMAAIERQHIIDALERAGQNQTLAAEILGISRRTLVSRLTEYDLPRPRKR
jgi:DNA-binding NtrC family response regulator